MHCSLGEDRNGRWMAASLTAADIVDNVPLEQSAKRACKKGP
jgi:hypothetical protein